jgi:integrase/recombinase XerD
MPPGRGRGGRPAEVVAGRRRARRLEAVPAPHQQGHAEVAEGDRVEDTDEAAASAVAGQVQAILDGCGRLRDRLLFAVLYDTGMRIGEALGLRHNDIAAAGHEVTVRRRDNANGARAKSQTVRTIPVSSELIRLFADYLHTEYGDLDSDYVFVNLWGRPHGHPLTYAAVYDLVRRLRRRTGIDFDPHWLRHTAATRLLRDGVGIEVVAHLLGHAHVATTTTTYGHLTVEDARRVMEQAGWFTQGQVRL